MTERIRTGLVTAGCYAAPLADCDGGACSREHYISENLLERFQKLGPSTVTGLAWADRRREVRSGEFVARVLCERHNHALSPLDAAMGRLFDAVLAVYRRESASVVLSGDDIELWGMKALFGMGVSRNVVRDGARVPYTPRLVELEALFGFRALPAGPGFYFYQPRIEEFPEDHFLVEPMAFDDDHPQGGQLFALRTRIFGLNWITSLVPLDGKHETLIYRPQKFAFDTVSIELTWSGFYVPATLRLEIP